MVEVESGVEAKRLWNALVKDGNDFALKQAPELFASISILEGDGGVGTVKQINFTAGIVLLSHTIYCFCISNCV